MMASKLLSRVLVRGIGNRLILASPRPEQLRRLISGGFHSLAESPTRSLVRCVPCQGTQLLQHSDFGNSALLRFGFSSSASPEASEKEASQSSEEQGTSQPSSSEDKAGNGAAEAKGDSDSNSQAAEQTSDAGPISEPKSSKPGSMKRRRSTKRTKFSDSDIEKADLSVEDLVKLVSEKEDLLKLKHKEIEQLQDKVLRSYAEMENVMERTKREAENSKKFAIQNFAKSLLDVADNLGRASSSVKDSFSKVDPSKDSVGAVPILKSLSEGVEMTEKQLTEVFKKFGVEKFDPTNEHFDPHRHYAVFQIPDPSKAPGTVAAVLKPGYMLYDRIIRPAEVGVTEAVNNEADQNSS